MSVRHRRPFRDRSVNRDRELVVDVPEVDNLDGVSSASGHPERDDAVIGVVAVRSDLVTEGVTHDHGTPQKAFPTECFDLQTFG